MALSLYNPQTLTTQVSSGAIGSDALLLNILIELRVMNEILLGNAGSNQASALRSDVVNETNNTPI